MTTHRTCSYTETLCAASWRLTYVAARHVLTDVEVVVDTLLSRSQLAALLTVRLLEGGARAEVSVDGRRVASYDLSRSLPEADGAAGSLFRRVVPLPAKLLDGRMHFLTVVVVDHAQESRATIANMETAFYARRASNRRLVAAMPVPLFRG